MPHRTRRTPQQNEPQLSVLALIRVDQARRKGIDPASVPVRELDARAERILREAGGFWGLVGSAP